jgi:hypothetical protein
LLGRGVWLKTPHEGFTRSGCASGWSFPKWGLEKVQHNIDITFFSVFLIFICFFMQCKKMTAGFKFFILNSSLSFDVSDKAQSFVATRMLSNNNSNLAVSVLFGHR